MINIAILGYGVVGTGLIDIIDKNREKNTFIKDIMITNILVRDIEKHGDKVYADRLTVDADDIFYKDNDIIIEVMGGIDPAYTYVKKALEDGKHVITANKDLVAEHGEELLEIAKRNNIDFRFEAAVAGGIPIIKAINESLSGNEINEVRAILNGTTNFMLTKMCDEELEYEEVLREAQELGFAEANPESDVMGYDAARKLSILSKMIFKKNIYWKDLSIEGITDIDLKDLRYAKSLGYNLKLIATGKMSGDKFYGSVRPTLVKKDSIFSNVRNEFNIVAVYGDNTTESIFIGEGAGKLPTGNAVYGDLLDVIYAKGFNSKFIKGSKNKVYRKYLEDTTALLRVSTNDYENVIRIFKENLDEIDILSNELDDELVLFVKGENETAIDNIINELIKEELIYYAKKIIAI